ncbi:dynamin family protein [Flavobacterium sp. 14A]|uniref:dynamin family protein n=1 Tax=Flavobacterium sp. 14A TaxID=2735896 RepID=UPI00156ED96B|nr:dynamin family protein [Flavobacterium sp. 14A]NRT10873.1 GTPase Era involved in 16S rRNA processing [Flavobacterium sp. 14A]
MENSKKNPNQLFSNLLNDIIHYNDIYSDLWEHKDDIWEKKLLKKLEVDAKILLEQSILVSGNQQPVRVAIVGNFSAGKSSFINSLIQEEICPVSDKPTTSSVTTLSFSHKKAFYILDINGNKKKISSENYREMIQHGTAETVKESAHFFIEGPWEFVRDISLLDTPGFENPNDVFTPDRNNLKGGDDEETERVIKNEADVLFWLMDINTGSITGDQKERIEKLKKETTNVEIYIILNKADQKVYATARQKILDDIKKDLGHVIKDVILYSSKTSNQNDSTDFNTIIQNIKSNIHNQNQLRNESWELKFSSSIGGRGKLRFHYNDNGIESMFSYTEDSIDEGIIPNRQEILKKLKEIGSRNKEITVKNLQIGLSNYEFDKKGLLGYKLEIQEHLKYLNETKIKKSDRYNNFNKHLNYFNDACISEVVNSLVYYNTNDLIKQNIDAISNSFMKLIKVLFNKFILNIEKELEYSYAESEIEIFDLKFLFKSLIFSNIDYDQPVQYATDETLGFFRTYLDNIFFEREVTILGNNIDECNQIIKKLEKIC